MTFSQDHEIVVSLADFKRLYKKVRPKLKRAAIFCALITACWILFKEPTYKAMATYKRSSKAEPTLALKGFLKNFEMQELEGDTVALMSSRTLLHRVVKQMGLQARIKERLFVSRILDNFKLELRLSLSDLDEFKFKEVFYEEEIPCQLYVRFIDPVSFELFDEKKQKITTGRLNQEVNFEKGVFTLEKTPKKMPIGAFISLTMLPWVDVVGQLIKGLEIKASKLDKNVLELTYSHRNRYMAAEFLNCVMEQYQKYLKEENAQIAELQLAYLEERQNQLAGKLDLTLNEQAKYLAKNLGDSGFIGLQQEVEMLAVPKEEYTSKLFDMDLELKRLEKGRHAREKRAKGTLPAKSALQNKSNLASESSPSELKSVPYEKQQKDFQKKLLALQVEQDQIQATTGLIAPSIFHQIDAELQGVNLATAQLLHVNYSQEKDAVQRNMKQLQFLRDHLHEPDFELSSLSSVLTDSVSQELVRKASELALLLRDEKNHTLKEQDRLREALEIQKGFIIHHIDQTIDLNQLQIQMIENKIGAIQDASIELIKNEKGLIEEKLVELGHRMKDLPEKWRLENQLKLKKELCKGVIEGVSQLIETKNLNYHLFQVESKPLDFAIPSLHIKMPHLFLYSSCGAFLGIFSVFVFYLFKGLVKGMPVSLETLRLYRQHISGSLSASCDTSLEDLDERDLETLRRMCGFINSHKKGSESVCVSIIGGKNPNYSQSLAKLLAMQELKVLLVECDFNATMPLREMPGLWHYLSGDIQECPIRSESFYDFLPTGGTTRHAPEFLNSGKFSALLMEKRALYDVILIFSHASPTFVEAQVFLKHADLVIVTLCEETIEDLSVYRTWADQKGRDAISFALCEEHLLKKAVDKHA